MAAIDIRSVRKTYGKSTILKCVDLSIHSGEFVVLVGPSGCGKSTLLRMIAGLEEVTSGEIAIAGRRVNELQPKERNLAMVFQSYALYPHMTVADNMSYALRLRNTPRQQIAAAVARAADILGLTQLLDRRPRDLSGGQRQRVAMGRAIVRQPQAFLFDEPLSNLDARLREHMRAQIKKLHAHLGATSVYVTHDQIEAMTLADRVVVMEGGEIQQIGSPLDLYERPANLFVAGFIGSPAMNILTGRVCRTSTNVSLEAGGQLRISLPWSPAVPHGSLVSIGIRPEHVLLGEPARGSGLQAQVDLTEPTGLGTIVHLTHGDCLIKAFMPGESGIKSGQSVPLALPADRLHLFDAVSSQRLVCAGLQVHRGQC